MKFAAQQLVMDFLTAIIFIAIYATTRDLLLAIGLCVMVAIVQIGFTLLRGRQIDAMVWLGLLLVIGLGGAALLAGDPRYVMFKPSVVHVAIAVVMLRRGWFGRYLPAALRERVSPALIVRSGYAWAGFMIVLALTNAAIAWHGDFTLWAWFASVGLIAAKLLAFGVQGLVFRRARRIMVTSTRQ